MTDAESGPTSSSDLFDFLNDDACTVPGVTSLKHPEGKTYTIPSPPAETGLRLQGLSEIAAKLARGVKVEERDVAKLKMDDDQEREFAIEVMGPTYHEMIEDGVSWVRIQRILQYAYIYFTQGATAAEDAARAGVLSGGKVLPPNRMARRHPATAATQSDRPASTGTSRKRRR